MRHAALALLMLLAGCESTPPQPAVKQPATQPGTTQPNAAQPRVVQPAEAATYVALGALAAPTKPGPAKAPHPDAAHFKESAQIEVRWHRNVGDVGYAVDQSANPIVHPGQVRWRMRRDYGLMGNSILRPVLLNGALYAVNAKGKILRLDPDSGEQVWRVDTDVTITGGLGAGEGLILAGGEKGEVVAYGEDGKLRWKSVVSSEVLGPPQIADGIVVVRSGDGRIAGLNAADGKRKWLYEHATPALVVRSSAGGTISHGTVFAGFAGGKLAALDLATGNVKWEATLSEPRGTTELERISDITSPPEVEDDTVCAVSFQGRIGCFGAAAGNLLWSHEFSSDKGLTLAGKVLYAVNANGELFAMDMTSGASIWKNSDLAQRETAAPQVLGDYLVAGDGDGYIYAFKREDGSLAARRKTDGSAILEPPLALNGGVLAQTYIGGLYFVTLH